MIVTEDGTIKQAWASYSWDNGKLKVKLACGHTASNAKLKNPPSQEGKHYTCTTCTNVNGKVVNGES